MQRIYILFQNVVLLAPPGVDKAHLAIGLAIAAAQSGRRVYYRNMVDLARAALIDIVLRRCHIVNTRGNCYRVRQHTELWQALRQGVEEPSSRSRRKAKEVRMSYAVFITQGTGAYNFHAPQKCIFRSQLTTIVLYKVRLAARADQNRYFRPGSSLMLNAA